MGHLAPKRTSLLIAAVASGLLAASLLYHQRTRVIEGTWIDLFEDSRFFEDKNLASACTADFLDAPWFAYYPEANTTEGKLVEANRDAGTFVSKYGHWPVAAYKVKFRGHHQILGLSFGHLGQSSSEYVVDHMISIEPIASPVCDTRPS
jgi:hypothetical protein